LVKQFISIDSAASNPLSVLIAFFVNRKLPSIFLQAWSLASGWISGLPQTMQPVMCSA